MLRRRCSRRSIRPLRTGIIVAAATAALTAAITIPATANATPRLPKAIPVPTPTIAGPVQTPPDLDGTHGIPYTSSAVDLASHGYTEQEYFVSGTARAYQPVGALEADGRWSVTTASQAAYKTRIIVRRPVDMHQFSGTIVVEWLNVTVGRDLDVGWVFGSTGMLNDHDIYVGVSAQANGLTNPTQGAAAWDPARYQSLTHPGDQYSYDIFSQIAQALRHPRGVNPIPGAHPKEIIAYGDSQSAFRLVTYLDAVQNRDQVYDGVLLNSRFGNGAALNTGADTTPPAGTQIRSDTTTKVLTLETETDIVRASNGFLAARQADSDRFRLWEVAGASHFNAPEEATMRLQAFRESPFANPPIQFNSCPEPMNTLDFTGIVDTAIHDLARWSLPGSRYSPPHADHLGVTADGSSYVKNSLGLTTGGVRLPQISAPTGVESGIGNTGVGTCTLAGQYLQFDAATLTSFYPTHQVYVAKFTQAVGNAERQGFLQPYDSDRLIAQAEASAIPATTNIP